MPKKSKTETPSWLRYTTLDQNHTSHLTTGDNSFTSHRSTQGNSQQLHGSDAGFRQGREPSLTVGLLELGDFDGPWRDSRSNLVLNSLR
jgi:hypothetical protein